MLCSRARPLLTHFAVDHSIEDDLGAGVMLFVKQRCVSGVALIADTTDPVRLHLATFGLGRFFAARDHPVDLAKTTAKFDRAEERLGRNESYCRRNLGQQVDALHVVLILDGYSEPDVRVPLAPISRKTVMDQLGTFREDQPVEVLAFLDDLPRFRSPRVCIGVKEIRQGTSEDSGGCSTLERLPVPDERVSPSTFLGSYRPVEWGMPTQLQPSGDVTVLARGRDFLTTHPRVPGVVSPADFGVLHCEGLFLWGESRVGTRVEKLVDDRRLGREAGHETLLVRGGRHTTSRLCCHRSTAYFKNQIFTPRALGESGLPWSGHGS